MYQSQSIPFAQGIHGKNDTKVGWVGKTHWYDSLNLYRQGGTWMWDQRKHNGNNANFLNNETKPDYLRFYTNMSYPAFTYCTINQDPGDGDSNDGDPYGAWNGYLDWDPNSVSDQTCTYTIKCMIKTFNVGGAADAEQYDTCHADLTVRRAQKFHPGSGTTINWTNYDAITGGLQQSGSFVYSDGGVTVPFVKILKGGSTVTLTINNCSGREEQSFPASVGVQLIRDGNKYVLQISSEKNQQASVRVFDMPGRIVYESTLDLQPGTTNVPLQFNPGSYIVNLNAEKIHFSGKMIF